MAIASFLMSKKLSFCTKKQTFEGLKKSYIFDVKEFYLSYFHIFEIYDFELGNFASLFSR